MYKLVVCIRVVFIVIVTDILTFSIPKLTI